MFGHILTDPHLLVVASHDDFLRRNGDALPIYFPYESAILYLFITIRFCRVEEDVMLQIRLLGQFDTRLDGKRVAIPTRAAQSLLAYLVLTAGTPHRREKLAGIFWPETSDENARKNLRQELWRIRKAISAQGSSEKDYFLADELTLTFNCNVNYWL